MKFQPKIEQLVVKTSLYKDEWDTLQESGYVIVTELCNKKFSLLRQPNEEYSKELKDILKKLTKTNAEMEKVSKNLSSVTAQLRSLKNAHDTLYDENEVLYSCFTFNDFIECSEEISSMYEKELIVKQEVLRSILHIQVFLPDLNTLEYRNSLMGCKVQWSDYCHIVEDVVLDHIQKMKCESGLS